METEESQFLNTIRAAPADDTPRLAFADWLEEQGQIEQAEAIRIYLALTDAFDEFHPGDCQEPGCRFCGLKARERAIVEANRKEWVRWIRHLSLPVNFSRPMKAREAWEQRWLMEAFTDISRSAFASIAEVARNLIKHFGKQRNLGNSEPS